MPDHVLFANYSEYLAPLWAPGLRRLRKKGVHFSAILHDPVRDYQVGPYWWHRKSVASAYSFLDAIFVHEPITIDTVRPFPELQRVTIPHGPYPLPSPTRTRSEVRNNLGIPQDAPLFISFGHIRDNKNIHLAIEALVEVPHAQLLVAGSEASAGNQPSGYYRELSRSLGVEDRCHWVVQYVSPPVAADLISASDYVLLAYTSTFRSASGVLNLTANFRKPLLASGGEGNLKANTLHYHLGVFVEPDNLTALKRGMKACLSGFSTPNWDQYLKDNSWSRNAAIVTETLKHST